ncbi:hypothetical protein FQA39_LY12585 [Lamprigera yunnana]|nr:hypothetical protein FQA39_LY12585 [Lamprigera yunnana]
MSFWELTATPLGSVNCPCMTPNSPNLQWYIIFCLLILDFGGNMAVDINFEVRSSIESAAPVKEYGSPAPFLNRRWTTFHQETLGENRENLETSEKNSALCISPIPGPSTRPVTPLIPTECNTSDQRDNKAESSFAITPADCNPLAQDYGKESCSKKKVSWHHHTDEHALQADARRRQQKKLELEEKRSKNKQSQSFIKKNVKLNIKPKKPVVKNSDSSSESNESQSEECIFCCEKFVNSSKGEGWIRCNKCLKWAHDQCAGVDEDDDDFTCDLCLSHTKTYGVKKQLRF